MYPLILSWLMLAAVVLAPQFALAIEVPNLYEAEVPVADQRATTRAVAARAALAEVLVKVMGNPAAAGQPQLQPLLQQAEQLLRRYQYRATPGGAAAQALIVTFDRQEINQRIYDAGLPVWGQNRPQIIVWLVMDEGGQHALISGDRRTELHSMVNARAARRGLPVTFPVDEDENAGTSSEALIRASERYKAEGVLIGRIYSMGPSRWRTQWALRHAGSDSGWESGEGALADVIASGIDAVAGHLAKRYALVLKPGVGDTATVVVSEIDKVQDYARVSRYLASLDAVSAVVVERVEGNKVVYRLQIRGGLQGFSQLVAMGRMLAPLQGDTPVAGELYFQLMP